MKVLLRCAAVVAAATIAITELETQDADYWAREKERRTRWFWWVAFPYYNATNYDALRRAKNLRCIAKHKMADVVMEVDDPYLSDIAAALPPYVSERI